MMRRLWAHIAECKEQHCRRPHCLPSRHVLAHYRRCVDSFCPVCGPVRKAAAASLARQKRQLGIVSSISGSRGKGGGSVSPDGAHPGAVVSNMRTDELKAHVHSLKTERMRMAMLVLMRKLYEHRLNKGVFNKPVDAEALGLVDYHTIVTQPMDLGSVRWHLELGDYDDHVAFHRDLRLVFKNACAFNPKGHPIAEAAAELLKYVDAEVPKMVERVRAQALGRKKAPRPRPNR